MSPASGAGIGLVRVGGPARAAYGLSYGVSYGLSSGGPIPVLCVGLAISVLQYHTACSRVVLEDRDERDRP